MQPVESQVRQWIEKAQQGDKNARNDLLRTHTGFVIYLAGRFHRAGHFAELGDLVQRGCIGLLKAIDRFDLTRRVGNNPVQFATYARFWIEHCIRREIDSYGRTIAVPVNIQSYVRRAARAKQLSQCGGGPQIDLKRMAKTLGISSKRLQSLQVEAMETTSLDKLMSEDSQVVSVAWARRLATEEPKHEYPSLKVESLLTALSTRERFLIEQRHGLNPGHGTKALHEVAKIMGISRERVRQIELRALERMRQAGAEMHGIF